VQDNLCVCASLCAPLELGICANVQDTNGLSVPLKTVGKKNPLKTVGRKSSGPQLSGEKTINSPHKCSQGRGILQPRACT